MFPPHIKMMDFIESCFWRGFQRTLASWGHSEGRVEVGACKSALKTALRCSGRMCWKAAWHKGALGKAEGNPPPVSVNHPQICRMLQGSPFVLVLSRNKPQRWKLTLLIPTPCHWRSKGSSRTGNLLSCEKECTYIYIVATTRLLWWDVSSVSFWLRYIHLYVYR